MICEKFKLNVEKPCSDDFGKFAQKLVLIHFDNIAEYSLKITSGYNEVDFAMIDDQNGGHHISYNVNGNGIKGSFNMIRDDEIPRYTHIVNFPLSGITGFDMSVARQLDAGKFVAALKFKNTVKIYGIENGLKTQGYVYDVQSPNKGGLITLKSEFNEDFPPLEYSGDIADFDTDFNNRPIGLQGSYNNDYNDDYDINFTL